MGTVKVIYIAGPYRAPNAWEIELNIRAAETVALEVWRLGAAAICPHTNTRFFQGAAPDDVWLDGDLAILAKCDGLLLLPTYERSVGARAERDYAIELGLPTFITLWALDRWLRSCG